MNNLQADPEILIAPIKKTVNDPKSVKGRVKRPKVRRSNLTRLVRKTPQSLDANIYVRDRVEDGGERLAKFNL